MHESIEVCAGTLSLLLCTFCSLFAQGTTGAPARISGPSADVKKAFNLAPFYTKYVSAQGFPVIGSAKVSDAAMREAAYLINQMLVNRDDVRKALIQNKVRFAVMAPSEKTTDIPEHSTLDKSWDTRARGLGPTPHRPAVSCGEENLLNLPGDTYPRENVLIHEFAHGIHEMGLNTIDKTFDARLKAIYDQAMQKKRWQNTYAATNYIEYWAEGVQSYFDCNDANNAVHNDIDTREKLARYDPELFQLIDTTFKKPEWRYVRYDKRRGTPSTVVADTGKPPATTEKVRLTVLNITGSFANLYYVREGKRTFYHRIAPGMKRVQDTYSGHLWEIVLDLNKEQPLTLEMPRNDYTWRLP